MPFKLLALLATLFGGGALAGGLRSSQIRREDAEPGAQPGTRQPGDPLISGDSGIPALQAAPDMGALINTLAENSPIGTSIYGQLQENERSRGTRRGILDTMLGEAEGSGLFGLADETGTFKAGALERLDAQRANVSQARERGQGVETRRRDLTGRVRELGGETQEYFRGVRDDPNILDERTIRQMAAEFAERSNQASAREVGRVEDQASRRGLSAGAVAALKTQIQQGEFGRLARSERDIDLFNAQQSTARGDAAASAMAALGDQAFRTEGGIDTSFSGLAETIFGRADNLENLIGEQETATFNKLTGLEGLFTEAAEGGVRGVRDKQFALEQPENLVVIGGLLDEVNRFNTAQRSGAFAQDAELFGGFSSQMLDLLGGGLERQAMKDAEPSSSTALLTSLLPLLLL